MNWHRHQKNMLFRILHDRHIPIRPLLAVDKTLSYGYTTTYKTESRCNVSWPVLADYLFLSRMSCPTTALWDAVPHLLQRVFSTLLMWVSRNLYKETVEIN